MRAELTGRRRGRSIAVVKAKWLLVLIGLMVAVMAAELVWLARSTSKPGRPTPVAAQPGAQEKKLFPPVSTGALETTNGNLQSQLSRVMTNEQFAGGISRMILGGVRQQIAGRITVLKQRLKLTEQQVQQIQAMFDGKLAAAGGVVTRMIQGKGTKADTQALSALLSEARAEAQRILSPEQWTEYVKFEAEQRQAAVQRMAGAELRRMQTELQLSDAQQAQVREVLRQQAAQQLEETQGGLVPPSDWAQYFEQRAQTKKEALRPVLSPEQLEKYERMEASRRSVVRQFLPH